MKTLKSPRVIYNLIQLNGLQLNKAKTDERLLKRYPELDLQKARDFVYSFFKSYAFEHENGDVVIIIELDKDCSFLHGDSNNVYKIWFSKYLPIT